MASMGGLTWDMQQRAKRLIADAPPELQSILGAQSAIASGYRSPEQQAQAIASVAARNGLPMNERTLTFGIPGMAAGVGRSKHQSGEALDWNFANMSPEAKSYLTSNAGRYGLQFPLPKSDSVHMEIDPKFYGPVQPVDELTQPAPATAVAARTQTAQMPPPVASPLPTPQQAPQSMLGQQEENTGLAGMFRNAIENPLVLAGIGLMSASGQGKDVGTGLMQGIGMAREGDKFARDRRKQQGLERLLAGGAPGMEGIPPALLAIAQATGDPSPIAQHLIKGSGTDDIKEYEYAKARGFEGSLQDWMVNKRASQGEYAKQLTFGTDKDGNIVPMQAGSRGDLVASKLPPGVQLQRDPIKIETATGTVLIDPTTRQQMGFVPKNVSEGARQTVEGRETGELQMLRPKAEAAVAAADAKTDVVLGALGDARKMVGQWTTGVPGSVMSNIPGTAAKDLKERIKTIIANAGFEELQTMRQNSPTGGALGQVAVQELEMLQKTVTSLDQAQSMEQVQKAMDEMEAFAKGSRERRRRAFESTYANVPQRQGFTAGQQQEAPRQQTQGAPVRVTSPDEARRLPSGTRIIIPGARPGEPDREGVVP